MSKKGKTIIYTDLDGTFLDEKDYSFGESLTALRDAQENGISVIFCSSKTRAEIEYLRKATETTDPFIVENGGAIFVPENYFPFPMEDIMFRGGYQVIELGESYSRLVDLFRVLRSGSLKLDIVGFSDLTTHDLALECGMTLDAANRAKAREYTEPFRFSDITPEKIDIFRERIRQSGRQFSTGGRYHHLQGHNNKKHAVEILSYLYRRAYGKVTTIGIGDSRNDAPMLSKVRFSDHCQATIRRTSTGTGCPIRTCTTD
jgi:mannosyl-3-phosphoglycerate phosphatase